MRPIQLGRRRHGRQSDYNTPPSFSNGVTHDPVTGTITVPAGVKDFTVTANTIDDIVVENPETVKASR